MLVLRQNIFKSVVQVAAVQMAQQPLPLAAVPVLPLELIVEILSWVPIKSLMGFRCVSKSWNSLVLDPTIVKLHLQRSSGNPHVLLRCSDNMDDEDIGVKKR